MNTGWETKRLRDLCSQSRRIVEGGSEEARTLRYLSLEHVESQTGAILAEPDDIVADAGKSTTFYFDNRHVLYGKLRPYLNKVALPDAPGRCTTEIIPLLPNDTCDRKFLAWVLRRSEVVDAVMRETTGSRMPRADVNVLLNLEFAIPSTIDEQHRIAAVLDEQMKSVEQARRAVEEQLVAANALPKASLRSVFESDGAQDWPEYRFGDVCKFVGGSQPPAHTFERTPAEDKVRLVQIQDFRRDDVPVYISKKEARRTFDKSDVMIGRYGPPVFQIFRGLEGAYNVALMKTVPDEGKLRKEFLYYLLQSEKVQGPVVAQSQRSAGQSGVQKDFLEEMIVRIPKLEMQDSISKMLQQQFWAARSIADTIKGEIEATQHLPRSLLRTAFIRVV